MVKPMERMQKLWDGKYIIANRSRDDKVEAHFSFNIKSGSIVALDDT